MSPRPRSRRGPRAQALLVLVLVGVAACDGGGSGSSSSAATFRLEGTVTDGALPLEGVSIGLTSAQSLAVLQPWERLPLDQVTVTDAAGRFAFDPVFLARGQEYYVFTGTSSRFNRFWSDGQGGLRGLPALPTRQDVDQLQPTALVNDRDRLGIDFVLDDSNALLDVPVSVGGSGVTLLTDVYLATDGSRPTEGSFGNPVIVVRSSYDKSGNDPAAPGGNALIQGIKGMVLLGYTVVIQNTRGRNGSGGQTDVFRTDAWGGPDLEDGLDTVRWAAQQSWSDGTVGMCGVSALAITAYLAAGADPAPLRACYVWAGTPDVYGLYFDPGGIYREEAMEPWLANQLGGALARDAYLNQPGGVVDNFYRSPFWDPVDLATRSAAVEVPMLHVTGWWDLFQKETIAAFEELQTNGGPGARGNQRLLVGPYSHLDWYDPTQGELVFPRNAGPAMKGASPGPEFQATLTFGSEARFFDHWLRLEPRSLPSFYASEPAVRYYVVGDVDTAGHGGNRWRTTTAWPPPDVSVTQERYFLVAGGERFVWEPEVDPLEMGSVTYACEPLDPVPTLGGAILFATAPEPAGPRDQRPAEARPDVETFTTDVLVAETEVTGRSTAHLAFSSDAQDTDFVVKLCDVYPDGRSILIAEGALQARFRDGFSAGNDLLSGDPTDVYAMDVDLGPVSVVFNAGHRIRISVTSSNSPRLKPNPNTGASFFTDDLDAANSQVALNTIWCEPGNPTRASYVSLPIATTP